MKSSIDIHIYLATADDMEDRHTEPEAAAEALNEILHITYDRADDDIESDTMAKKLESVWENWHTHPDLASIDIEDLVNWVDHLLNT